jgi:putative transcriptional regulator
MKQQCRNPLMASIHETAAGLRAAGVMYKRTLREFDDLCLTPVQPSKVSQARALLVREGAKNTRKGPR